MGRGGSKRGDSANLLVLHLDRRNNGWFIFFRLLPLLFFDSWGLFSDGVRVLELPLQLLGGENWDAA